MKIKNTINQSFRLLFWLSSVWALVLLLLGSWWIYLLFNFENILAHTDKVKVTKMIIWEGGSFLTLLLMLSFTLLILYIKDQKKTKSLQAFFASLTHELKTPLASIRLQGEVINEILSLKNDPSLNKLSARLIEDTVKLETQMDKILQLSRIERGGELNLTSLNLIPYIKNISKKMNNHFDVNINASSTDILIIADEFALELILKNLFENTKVHTYSKKVNIDIVENAGEVILNYQDDGQFEGDQKRLGELFYKYNSTKGSGIGLYLTQKLLSKMNGSLKILGKKNLQFQLKFKSVEETHA